MIFLKKKWSNNEENYLIVIILLNIVFNLLISTILYTFLSYQIEGVSYVSFLFVSLSMTLFEILKKYIFSSNNISIIYAMLSSILLNILFFGFLFIFKNELNLNEILKAYWFSFSLVVLSLLSFFYFKKVFNVNYKNLSCAFIIDVAKTHINYSKWLILGGIAFWGYSQGIYIIAKSFNIDDLVIGKVRTIQNLLGIFNILAFTIENYYTPIFSSKVKKNLIAEVIPSLKEYYKDEPLFKNSKVVVSIYGNEITGNLNKNLVKKIQFDEVQSETLGILEKPTYLDLFKNAILNSDGVVIAGDETDESILELVKTHEKPLLKFGFKDGFKEEYLNFYNTKILN